VDDGVGRLAFFVLGLAGVGDGECAAVGQHQHAGVAGLAAAERIEHRAVEHDAVLVDAQDAGFAGAQVGIGTEQVLGHAAIVADARLGCAHARKRPRPTAPGWAANG
jgi:hypothetical protein